jgi:catechol 2,3-dioxygenase-like lactoylglutathione lyase family enzyme
MRKAHVGLALAGVLLAPAAVHAQGAGSAPAIELSHFMSAYSVADIEAVTKFYVEVLDFKVVKDVPLGEAMHFRWLRNGNQGIELVQMANSAPGPERGTPPAHLMVRGPGQLMLQVQDIEATKAALLAKGVTPSVDITNVAPLGIKVMFVNDPEGNPIEIVEVTEG